MRIGRRLFPYPVLNSVSELSDYISDAEFEIRFRTDESGAPITNDEELVLADLHYHLVCPALEKLIDDGLANVALVMECSKTVYRKVTVLHPGSIDMHLPLTFFSDKVYISCYIYAAAAFDSFKSEQFREEYDGLSFEIEKYALLAVDDGVYFTIPDSSNDDKISSIFTVVKVEDPLVKTIEYQNESGGISILLPGKYYDCYENLKLQPNCNSVSFAIMAIPVLASCFEEIKDPDAKIEDMDELLESYAWFNSVCLGYKRAKGEELDFETFVTSNSFVLAQVVLNYSSCAAINDFNEFLLGGLSLGQTEMEDDNE